MHVCMQINKYHAIALHLTCMGTSHISGVNVRHGFEQAVFLGRLSTMFIRGCPNEIYRRVVHSIIEVCPNEKYRRVVQHFIGVCPMNLHEDKNKNHLF